MRRAVGSSRFRLLLPRFEVFGQTLEPHHQRGVALDLDVLVLYALHESELLVLRVHGGEAVGAVLEADGKGWIGRGAAVAGDALILDPVVTSHFAIEGVQLKGQVLVTELLLEIGVIAAGLGHQATKHPEKKAKFHDWPTVAGKAAL